MFFETFYRSYRHSATMTSRALVEVFAHLLPDSLRFEFDGVDDLSAITTVKRYLSAFRIEGVFAFFSE